jgi:hypothetical protein
MIIFIIIIAVTVTVDTVPPLLYALSYFVAVRRLIDLLLEGDVLVIRLIMDTSDEGASSLPSLSPW